MESYTPKIPARPSRPAVRVTRSIDGKHYPAYVNAPRGGMTLAEYHARGGREL